MKMPEYVCIVCGKKDFVEGDVVRRTHSWALTCEGKCTETYLRISRDIYDSEKRDAEARFNEIIEGHDKTLKQIVKEATQCTA